MDEYLIPLSKQELATISCKQCYRINTYHERKTNFGVCVFCGFHNYLPMEERIDLLLDQGSWSEYNYELTPVDRLGFADSKKYCDRIEENIKRTGHNSAVMTGCGTINGIPIQLAIMNFKFMGGSLGSVEGEKITLAIEQAIKSRTGMVIVCASGGARMQESSYSLFQMAKTSAAIKRLSEERLPYISILTNPTTGGVSASFAFLGNIIIAEPKAMIGFTGRRVIEQTIKTKLPVNFQTAEFLMHRGLLDTIVARSKMKEYLFKVLSMFTGAKQQNSLGKQSPQTYPALPAKYTPAETLKIARHPDRPYSLDYIGAILDDGSSFELRGDRHFSNDDAIVTFFGTIDGQKVLIIGEEKGRTFEQKERRHFGMVKPEGFRKALRIAKIAEKFDIPIITLVDTPGAFPGVGAEERGQSEAIAYNLFEFSHIRVPIITIVIGEGGSGGALAIAAANSLALLEHAVFSVISPEGCAAILWEDKSKIELAIKNLKMLSHDLYQQGIADHVIPEPSGGAHANVEIAANTVKQYILNQLACYSQLSTQQIINLRDRRIRNIGR